MFWNNMDEIFCINELSPDNFSVLIFSKRQDSIEKYQELFPQIKWTILPDRTNERNRFDIGLV